MRVLAAALVLVLSAVPVLADGTVADVDRRALARLQDPPLGLPMVVPQPADNRATAARIALGRKLFFDRRLSHNATMSCAMCHVPEQGFAQNELATPVGVEGRTVRRNAPTVLNAAYQVRLFHDAREDTLELQILGPLLARNEMANPSAGHVLATIRAQDDYDGLFEAAFGEPVSLRNLGRAIAAWERTLLSGDSPFDRWRYGGRRDAVDAGVKRGFDLFRGKGGCTACHFVGGDDAMFTDHSLHNTGVGYRADVLDRRAAGPVPVQIAPGVVVSLDRAAVDAVGAPPPKDLGRMEITNDPDDLYAFKTPGLRDVALTAPYMHDGSLATLAAVVDFYDRGGIPNPNLDPVLQPLHLTAAEKADLVAFLRSLTGGNMAELIADARSGGVGNLTAGTSYDREPAR
ncbi:MAG: methylamine utilization protein MauG [Hyphomicrobiales bacterium]|nr:methylamine utilization protein MauG [Hyphomicrobiales bacterium]